MSRINERDLDWALTSPSLITHELALPDQEFPGMEETQLRDFLERREKKSHRVGRYFEDLIEFWLTEIQDVELIARGHQIFDANEKTRTIGELDFVWRDDCGTLIHLETAVKFYLHDPGENHTGSQFVGPNARDTFERKIARLLDHQLPLSARNYSEPVIPRALVRGRIFYHPDSSAPETLPDFLNPDHLRGEWLHQGEIDRLDHSDREFHILEKPHWFTAPQEPGMSLPDFKKRIEAAQHPVLSVSRTNRVGSPNELCSFVFIVPDRWPDLCD
ncbi:MAG: DUF1853 family protein [Verrucomicrobiales bacterium]|nr:DUF1853 family protein [Verrucomicrobiales bacterium]